MFRKKLIILVVLIYHTFITYGQLITSEVLTEIEKNIIYYRAVESYLKHTEIDESNHFKIKNEYLEDKFPTGNQKLSVVSRRISEVFPDTNIILYEIINRNEAVINLGTGIIETTYRNNHCFCEVFLVGFNSKSNQIVYIGGNFFRDRIYHYFDLSVTNPHTFDKYLKLKYYNYNLSKIKLIKKRKKYLIFRGFSEISKEYFYFKVGTKPVHNIENITFSISDRKRKRWDKK
jgi:hypothetical protein